MLIAVRSEAKTLRRTLSLHKPVGKVEWTSSSLLLWSLVSHSHSPFSLFYFFLLVCLTLFFCMLFCFLISLPFYLSSFLQIIVSHFFPPSCSSSLSPPPPLLHLPPSIPLQHLAILRANGMWLGSTRLKWDTDKVHYPGLIGWKLNPYHPVFQGTRIWGGGRK